MPRKVLMVTKNRKMTRFMQHADMFEQFKILAGPVLEITFNDTVVIQESVDKLVQRDTDPEYGIVALFDHNKIYYRDETVITVSDGQKFWVLDDYIKERMDTF